MDAEQPPTPEQQRLANRAQVHFQFAMAMLSMGDWKSADDYVKDVEQRDGRRMARNVKDMVLVELTIQGIAVPPELL